MSNLENELLEELQKVLKLEEEFWKLKSRIQWIQDGDANTKFFHLTTLQRRRKNRIFSIRDEAGNWLHNPKELTHIITNFYKNLYTTNHTSSQKILIYTHALSSITPTDHSPSPESLMRRK